VKGVRVDSATLVENYIVTNDVIKTQVSGFVRGAQIVKKDVQADGGVEITVRVPLWGVDSLITPFLNEKAIGSQNLPPEPESGEGPTGLVIDARGTGLKPAFFPMVVDEKGTVVYGPEMIDRATVEKNGAVQYQTLPKGANISSLFGEDAYVIRPVQIALVPREGRRPLKIKGVDKAGALKANILISSDDAKKIRGDAQMSAALRRSKVVVVTDPLIGGMEGRVPEPTGPVVANGPGTRCSADATGECSRPGRLTDSAARTDVELLLRRAVRPIPPWGTPFAAGHPLHFPEQRVPGAPVRHATRSALASAE
jgi:hypothetical protein